MKKVFIEKDESGVLDFKEKSDKGYELCLPDIVWKKHLDNKMQNKKHQNFLSEIYLLAENGECMTEESANEFDAAMADMVKGGSEEPAPEKKIGFV